MVMPTDPPINQAPPDLDPSRDLPRGFYEFLLPLHRAFTPRRIEELKGEIERYQDDLLAGLPRAEVCDLGEFCYRLPLIVITSMLARGPTKELRAAGQHGHGWYGSLRGSIPAAPVAC